MTWYKKNWVCIALLFIFFPAGAFLLWKYHSDFNKKEKIGLTAVTALIFVVIFSTIIGTCFSKVLPEELSLDAKTFTLDLNETKEIQVIVEPDDADVSSVEFISDNENIASFEKSDDIEQFKGKVTALKEGTTSVYVKFEDIESEKVEIVVIDKERIEAERKEKAADVDELISAIGEVTLKSKSKIETARSAYDDLETECKKYVANYDELTSAEDKYEELYNDAVKKAKEVENIIDKIGEVTADSEETINEARSAYDALDDDVKDLVTNYVTLTRAESKLKNIKAEEERKAQQELERQQQQAAANSSSGSSSSSSSGSYDGQTGSGNSNTTPSYGTVYWTPNGEKYHTTRDCPTLSRSKTIYSGTVAEAQANGKSEECKVCG